MTQVKHKKWTQKEIKLLGKYPDAKVAQITGRNTSAVLEARTRRGIPGYHKRPNKVDWTPIIPHLGNRTDAAIAEEFGLGRTTVSGKRRRLGISAFNLHRAEHGLDWDVIDIDEFLGKLPDAFLAEYTGISAGSIATRRMAKGIKSCTKEIPVEDIVAELGTMPDRAVARKYGVNNKTVTSLRKRHGIPIYKKPTHE